MYSSMKTIKSIAFIGGTGRLAIPLVNLLVENGYQITAIVRDLERSRRLLPEQVRFVKGDLKDPASINAGLSGVDAVYINLSTETDQLNLPFYEEREGVKTIVEAARRNGLVHIYKIGAAGAYPDNIELVRDQPVPNRIRLEGQRYIEESGIPYTIFDPTMFMDNLSNQIKGKTIQWIGSTHYKNYWVSADDYARQVLNAINNPYATNRHYIIQGPELLTPQELFTRFTRAYDSPLKVQVFPLWLIRLIGLFNPEMRFLGHMFSYFGQTKVEPFQARSTWDELGKPTVTIEEYARRLKRKPTSIQSHSVR